MIEARELDILSKLLSDMAGVLNVTPGSVYSSKEADTLLVMQRRMSDCELKYELSIYNEIFAKEKGASIIDIVNSAVAFIKIKILVNAGADSFDTVAMKGSEFNEDKVKRGSFGEIFGFAYENKNAWEIYEELLALNKVSGDLSEGIFDDVTYEITKQRLYEFEANEELWRYMLEGLVYDEIIDKQVTYQVMETKDGLLYPDCFVATVVYSDAGWKVTKSMFLQVIVCK